MKEESTDWTDVKLYTAKEILRQSELRLEWIIKSKDKLEDKAFKLLTLYSSIAIAIISYIIIHLSNISTWIKFDAILTAICYCYSSYLCFRAIYPKDYDVTGMPSKFFAKDWIIHGNADALAFRIAGFAEKYEDSYQKYKTICREKGSLIKDSYTVGVYTPFLTVVFYICTLFPELWHKLFLFFKEILIFRHGKEKRILELDIEKCFDRISHNSIMKGIIAPQSIMQRLYQCLKVGVNPAFPEQGTPQGGVISPLLANIALNGIEEIHPSVRYADDMVFMLKPNDNAEEILKKVKDFLAKRMMKVSEAKTRLVSTLDGFDFLGWRFYVQRNNGKFRSEPSKANYETFHKKVKAVILNPSMSFENRARKLAPIVRGWRNYHKYAHMKGSRFSLWRMNHAAFRQFLKGKTTNRKEAEKLVLKAFPAVGVKENGFINVKGNASPYDGNIIYWNKRNSDKYDNLMAKMLRKQKHTCGKCNLSIWDEEVAQLHNIDGNHKNWKWQNLMVVHQTCHKELHYSV
jgi:hypothetical protein